MSEQQTNKTVLGPDCRITGELALDNDAVIMGQFKGTLRVSGVLEIIESARVSGTIVAGALRVAGRVEANVVAEHGVELLAGAELTGQLYTTTLSVVEGAILQSDVCVGPKAMQAAGALLRQVQAATAESQDDDAPARSIAPATDAQETVQPAWPNGTAQPVGQTQSEEDEQADAEIDADTDSIPVAMPVRTVPSSLNNLLSRRRSKVLGSTGLKPTEGENHTLKPNPAARAS